VLEFAGLDWAYAVRLLINIAWLHVSVRLRQTLVGIFGVATGVGFTIMMAGLMQGSQKDFIRQLIDTLPHVTVSDERGSPPVQPAEQVYAIVQTSYLAKSARQHGIKYPYVVMSSIESWLPGSITPSVKTTAMIHSQNDRVGVTLNGIDPRLELQVSQLGNQMRKGQVGDLSKASNALIIGEALAQKLGIRAGDRVTISGGDEAAMSATIVGLFRSGIRQIDEGQIYSLIKFAQILAHQTGLINQFRVRLRNPLAAQEIATQLEAQTGYKAISWQEANSDLLSAFAVRDLIMLAIMGAMLLMSSFATYNIISTITFEKRHDIAIMKSLGMRENLVRRIFILESAMIGAVGILGGWVLGFLLCISMSRITVFNPFSGETVPLQIYYSPVQYFASGLIALGCCAAAAFFPARKATRVHPVDIIRGAS
jgi:lipoprotein-releasing system permease protein